MFNFYVLFSLYPIAVPSLQNSVFWWPHLCFSKHCCLFHINTLSFSCFCQTLVCVLSLYCEVVKPWNDYLLISAYFIDNLLILLRVVLHWNETTVHDHSGHRCHFHFLTLLKHWLLMLMFFGKWSYMKYFTVDGVIHIAVSEWLQPNWPHLKQEEKQKIFAILKKPHLKPTTRSILPCKNMNKHMSDVDPVFHY